MKTFFTTLFLLTLLFVAKSQTETYKPIFNGDVEFDENTPIMNEGVIYENHHFIVRDTIISSSKYYYYSYEGGTYIYISGYYACEDSVYYAREDTINRKVWSFNGITHNEKIMYDFSMQVGDSIFLEIAQNYYDSYPYYPASAIYYLDSITPYWLNNGDTTRKYYLNCKNQPELAPLVWIEGVGSVNNLFYTIIGIDSNPLPLSLSFCKECEGTCFKYIRNVLCMQKNNNIFFKNDCYNYYCMDTCQSNQYNLVEYDTYQDCALYKVITVNVEEAELCLKKIKHLSNHIELDEMCNYKKMELYNYCGQVVYEKNVSNQKTINFPDYLKGFYIVKLTDSNNNQVALKVILN